MWLQNKKKVKKINEESISIVCYPYWNLIQKYGNLFFKNSGKKTWNIVFGYFPKTKHHTFKQKDGYIQLLRGLMHVRPYKHVRTTPSNNAQNPNPPQLP